MTGFEFFQNDPLLAKLVRKSALTQKQLATYLAFQAREYKTPKPNIYERFGQKTSKGVFHRTLHQARRNIKRSILTIILLGYLDITDVTDVTHDITDLLEVGQKIRELKGISEAGNGHIAEKRRASELLSEILDKIDLAVR